MGEKADLAEWDNLDNAALVAVPGHVLATLVAIARAARADHDDDGHGCPRRPDRCAVCGAMRNVTDTATREDG